MPITNYQLFKSKCLSLKSGNQVIFSGVKYLYYDTISGIYLSSAFAIFFNIWYNTIVMSTPATGNQMSPMIQLGCIAAYQMGMSIAEIARLAGCAYTTVKGIVNNPDLIAKYTNQELTKKLKKQLPDRIFEKASAVLQNINPDDPNMSEAQKATVFGILFDKYRLSSGQATQIVDYNELTSKIVDVDAQITELEDKLKLGGIASTQQQIEEKK